MNPKDLYLTIRAPNILAQESILKRKYNNNNNNNLFLGSQPSQTPNWCMMH
jgi:hypothetical protein